jgi:hypothetical protein
MKAATLSEIKKELNTLPPEQLVELCLRLSKYKKENKELLNYLLFEQQDEAAYINGVKNEMDEQFAAINHATIYFVKKSLRKILRTANKYIKYSGNKQTEVELLLYYCQLFKDLSLPMDNHIALQNIYYRQIQKIKKALSTLHEDIQYDYKGLLDDLII